MNDVRDGQTIVAAVDVGGTTLKGELVGASGEVLFVRSTPTPVEDGPVAVVQAVRELTRALAAASADDAVGGRLAAVGVVVPGIVDTRAGVARNAVNLGWRDVELRAVLEADLAVPVALGHDVRAAGLAERIWGTGGMVSNVLVVVIGTGIAAVATVDGAVLEGGSRLAGEFGHLHIGPTDDWPDVRCSCRQFGCLETVSSAAAISRRYCELAGVSNVDTREVVRRLQYDPLAAAVWRAAMVALGRGLAAYVTLVDPSLIILSGGLANAGEALRVPVSIALADHLRWRSSPPIAVSTLASHGGRMGAAALAWDLLAIPYPTAFKR